MLGHVVTLLLIPTLWDTNNTERHEDHLSIDCPGVGQITWGLRARQAAMDILPTKYNSDKRSGYRTQASMSCVRAYYSQEHSVGGGQIVEWLMVWCVCGVRL